MSPQPVLVVDYLPPFLEECEIVEVNLLAFFTAWVKCHYPVTLGVLLHFHKKKIPVSLKCCDTVFTVSQSTAFRL